MQLKNLFNSWYPMMIPYLKSEDFKKVSEYISNCLKMKFTVLPEPKEMFKCFELCPYENLKVVLVAREPYNKPTTASGLALSSKTKEDIPLATEVFLTAIEENLYDGFNLKLRTLHEFSHVAQQGVLLFNTALTTLPNQERMHIPMWTEMTDYVIKHLTENHTGLVYILIGTEAQRFTKLIDPTKNYLFTLDHPDNSKQTNGYWSYNNIFSQVNTILEKLNKSTIDWERTPEEVDDDEIPF